MTRLLARAYVRSRLARSVLIKLHWPRPIDFERLTLPEIHAFMRGVGLDRQIAAARAELHGGSSDQRRSVDRRYERAGTLPRVRGNR